MTVVTEAIDQRCSVKKVFLEIVQNSQENTCARVSFNKVAGFLITLFFIEHLRQLLLLQDLSFTCTLKIFFR